MANTLRFSLRRAFVIVTVAAIWCAAVVAVQIPVRALATTVGTFTGVFLLSYGIVYLLRLIWPRPIRLDHWGPLRMLLRIILAIPVLWWFFK
jgi:hypothetical protein